jgi:hypothetical protein
MKEEIKRGGCCIAAATVLFVIWVGGFVAALFGILK